MIKVWLDAGHGGKDCGATAHGLLEANIALGITLSCGKVLSRHGIEVGYTRTTDVFIDLSERCRMANKWGADYFIASHVNAGYGKGTETFNYINNTPDSLRLAQCIQNYMVSHLQLPNRGVKQANFAVLRETNMVSVLNECCFIDSDDYTKIDTKQEVDAIGVVMAKAILAYLGIQYKEEGEVINMETVVLYFGDADVFSAIMKAQQLKCSLMKASDYDGVKYKAKNVVRVGGANATYSGSDRFQTFKAVGNSF